MTTKLVYKGDLIENFGEFLPSPYIEQTRLYNERIEVDVSIFLTDKEYGKVTDAGAYDIVMTQDFGASPSSDMGKFLQNYKNNTQGKNLGQPDSLDQRSLTVYIAFEFCIKKGDCSGVYNKIFDEILDPGREYPLYDYFLDTEDDDGNKPYLGIPFTDFVESDALLFAEDGTRIVQYKYTYTFYNPVLTFNGGVFGAGTVANLYGTSGDTGVFTGGNMVCYGFSSYIPKETFEDMYGSGRRDRTYSSDHRRGHDAAPPLYELARGQFSDVSYEVILESGVDDSGNALDYGTLQTHVVTWVDAAGAVYPRAPIRDISGRHRKVGALDGEGIKTEFEAMINEFRQLSSMDEETQNASDEILSVLQTYSVEPKSEIGQPLGTLFGPTAGPAILVMEKLQTLRKMWPNKSQGTTAGKLYYMFKSLIGNVQARLVKQEAVRKRKQRNLKIFDLRFDSTESSYQPGISDISFDSEEYWPLQKRGLEGSMIKFENQLATATSFSGKDILPFDFAPESTIKNITDDSVEKPYTVFRRGYYFFDYELALYMHSVINKTFNVRVLERWFGKSMIQSKFIVSSAKLEKYTADISDINTIVDYIRTWYCSMYSNEMAGRSNTQNSLLFPANTVSSLASSLPAHGGGYTDSMATSGKRTYGHLIDYDESEWDVSPTYKRPHGDKVFRKAPIRTKGVPNALTPNRKRGLDPDYPSSTLFVGTPPLPLPKRVYVDNEGHDANLFQTPTNRYDVGEGGGRHRGVFPGYYSALSNRSRYWGYSFMIPRNMAGIGGAFAFNKDVGLADDDSAGMMARGHINAYDESTMAINQSANGLVYPSADLGNDGYSLNVTPSSPPYGYRMMTFEFTDIYAGEGVEWLAMETGTHDTKTMKYRARVRVRDYTAAIARALMDSFESMISGVFREYVEMATEYCAYNQVDDSFTAFFADAITEFYRDSHPEWTPWFKAPLVYFLHRDLLFSEFGGGTKAAKDDVITSALNLAEKISPYTGNLASLLAFEAEMRELYDEYYGPDGVVLQRIIDLEEAGDPLEEGDGLLMEWQRKLRFHTGDDPDYPLAEGGSGHAPWPIDITQQGDVEDFAQWDVTINEFDHDPICTWDGGPPGSTDGTGYEHYLAACTKYGGLVEPEGPSDGDGMDFGAVSTFGDGIPSDKRYFYPGTFGLSGTGGESTLENTHDFSDPIDSELDGETDVGDRVPHFASTATGDDGVADADGTWEDCYCYCRNPEDISMGIDGGWVNVVRIVCPSDDPEWPDGAALNMAGHLIAYVDGVGIYPNPYGMNRPSSAAATPMSGPDGACYIMAAVDTYMNDPQVNREFLMNIMNNYPGMKIYDRALDTGSSIFVGAGGGASAGDMTIGTASIILYGDYAGMEVALYTELTRHPSGGSALAHPAGGLASEGDNGQKALGFCVVCRIAEGAQNAGVYGWMARKTYAGDDGRAQGSAFSMRFAGTDFYGPRIDCDGSFGPQGDADIDIEREPSCPEGMEYSYLLGECVSASDDGAGSFGGDSDVDGSVSTEGLTV